MTKHLLAAPKGALLTGALLAGLFIAMSATQVDAHARSNPSFSCRSISNGTEHAICHSRWLARLDRRMAHWYGKAKVRAYYFDVKPWLREQQLDWLYERNACGRSKWCIARKYRQRIRKLRNWVSHV